LLFIEILKLKQRTTIWEIVATDYKNGFGEVPQLCRRRFLNDTPEISLNYCQFNIDRGKWLAWMAQGSNAQWQ
jgi:hypothetical protein